MLLLLLLYSLATNQLNAFLHHNDFAVEQSHYFVICLTNFTAKMLQVIYFVIRCEAKFCKVQLEISNVVYPSEVLT